MIDPQVLEGHGLKPDEYDRIVAFMGREPNLTELGIFSVMWSEHCSYKSSRVHLKTLPTGGPQVLQGPGENAGAVDIGDGLAAVFKIESHNHRSEEHTSELQSLRHLVCRLLLEKKKKKNNKVIR